MFDMLSWSLRPAHGGAVRYPREGVNEGSASNQDTSMEGDHACIMHHARAHASFMGG